MLRHSRLIATVVICAFWGLMMALLAWHEGYLPFGDRPQPQAKRLLKPSDNWMGIYSKSGTRVGYVNTTTFPDVRGGAIGASVNVNCQLKVTLLSMPLDIVIAGTAFVPQEEGATEFNFQLRSAEHTMRLNGTLKNGLLQATVLTAGEEIPLNLPVGKDAFIANSFGAAPLNVPRLKVGDEIIVDTFDPMTMSQGKAKVTCVGEETLTILGEQVPTKVIVTQVQGLSSKAWITDEEEVVRAETPLGLYLEKIAPQEALLNSKEAGDAKAGEDLIEAVAIRPSGLSPFRGARAMRVKLTNPGAQTPPGDDVQTVDGVQLQITVPSEPVGPVPAPSGMDDYLVSDPFIQSDHEFIKRQARNIVGEETDTWRKAVLVHNWVYANIEKSPVFSIPSALETLQTREGDCNEHAVLYTALARAAGVPARVACGVVWSDDLRGFYYHAWPEVYAGKWIWMDPTFGQVLADATHIKLLSGSLEQWPQLAAYLGQLQLEVLQVN